MRSSSHRHDDHDDGFSLVELLIVIVVLGIMSTVVVAAVRGSKDDAQSAVCDEHKRRLMTAVETYFAQNYGSELPASGAVDDEQYERGLVDAELIREVSIYYDIEADGGLHPQAGSPCT